MMDDNNSLLDSLQASAQEPGDESVQATEADMNAVADALLQASMAGGEGGANDPGAELPSALLEAIPTEAMPAEGSLSDIPNPGENPDPELAVEEMLSEAVLAEPHQAETLPTPEPSAVPTFQLKIFLEKNSSRDELKKIAIDLGLTLPDATWVLATPLISQLNEYQALYFLRQLRGLGLRGSVEARYPHSAPSEEDLALGELSAVTETPPVKAEGGAAVKLPGEEKSVLLYTGDALPAFPVLQTLGLVSAHRSLPRRLFRQDEVDEKLRRELSKVPGRAASLPKSRTEQLLRELSLELQKAALAVAGNAVLGIKLQAFPETNHSDPSLDELRLVAFGTAAVVEKWSPE